LTENFASKLFTEGDTLYADMIDMIDHSTQSVCLESYIFHWDSIGQQIASALVRAAQRGVQVQVHLDAWGVDQAHFNQLQDCFKPPVQLKIFGCWDWHRPFHYLYRNHRKLLIVDDTILYTGSFNITSLNSKKIMGDSRWFDCHIKVTGKPAQWARYCFDRLWSRLWLMRTPRFHQGNWSLIPNQTFRSRFVLRHKLISHIKQAHTSIFIITPYFVPGKRLMMTLSKVAQRGVQVTLVVPLINDHPSIQELSERYLKQLQKAGVSILSYIPRMIHAKTMLIDEQWCSIGTSNLDYRSFRFNYELNLFVSDHEVIRQLQDIQHQVIAESRPWNNMNPRSSFMQKCIGHLLWPFRRLF